MQNPKTESDDEILQRAKDLFWAQSESWSGNRWDWDEADEEIKNKWIIHAKNGTRAPLKDEI
jgi:hypothetical protein